MDEKMTMDLLNRYKELAYSRRATLRYCLDLVENNQMTPDERLDAVKKMIQACGITTYSRENPTDPG